MKKKVTGCRMVESPLEVEARMFKRRIPLSISILILFMPLALTTNGDSSFRGNRRPGILAAPTEIPMGENALLYLRLGKLLPNELLDLVSD